MSYTKRENRNITGYVTRILNRCLPISGPIKCDQYDNRGMTTLPGCPYFRDFLWDRLVGTKFVQGETGVKSPGLV